MKLYINNFWIEFKCTYKILRLSLKALGESIQKPKIPAPYSLFTMQTFLSDNLSVKESDFDLKEDYLNFIKQFGSHYSFKKFILEYCNHDINILLNTYPKILEILTKNLVVGNFYSASTLAFNIFIKNFNNFKIKFYHGGDDSIFKNAFYGGRCEIFGNPTKKFIQHFDFPGMYSLNMEGLFPIGDYTFVEDVKTIKCGFYYISFYSDLEYPVLPYKLETFLVFPRGEAKGLYWLEEINLFLKEGGKIIKIYFGYEFYDEQLPVFKKFIDYYNTYKSFGGLHKIVGKLIINSFYGRLGLKGTTKKMYLRPKQADYTKNLYEVLNKDYTLQSEFNIMHEQSNLIYAAIITSRARILLYNALKSVLDLNGEVLYCDTDSIICAFDTKVQKTSVFEFKDEKTT